MPGWNEPGKIDEYIANATGMIGGTAVERMTAIMVYVTRHAHEAAHMADKGADDDDWSGHLGDAVLSVSYLLVGIPEPDWAKETWDFIEALNAQNAERKAEEEGKA